MRNAASPGSAALRRVRLIAVLLAAVCAGLAAGAVPAQGRGDGTVPSRRSEQPARHPVRQREYFDSRYHHDRPYINRGVFVRGLPRNSLDAQFGGRRYFFAGGAWYLPRGAGFVVVAPPLGLLAPALPPFYTTLWVGGVPYYYANDVYYVYRGPVRGYEVVAPPPVPAAAPASPPPPRSAQQFIYPNQGQSAEQQATDRYQCHAWAAQQTGFDPAAPNGGVSAGERQGRRADYDRAERACLEGRGYTVK